MPMLLPILQTHNVSGKVLRYRTSPSWHTVCAVNRQLHFRAQIKTNSNCPQNNPSCLHRKHFGGGAMHILLGPLQKWTGASPAPGLRALYSEHDLYCCTRLPAQVSTGAQLGKPRRWERRIRRRRDRCQHASFPGRSLPAGGPPWFKTFPPQPPAHSTGK